MATQRRDRRQYLELIALGWTVHRIWECETSSAEALRRLLHWLKAKRWRANREREHNWTRASR